jgi:hypothetical protein
MEVISWQAVTSGRLINRSHLYNRATNYRPISRAAVSLGFQLTASHKREKARPAGRLHNAPPTTDL